MSSGYYTDRTKLYLSDLHRGLINATHILHHHGILASHGHISVRNPDDPSSFFLPRATAPALLSSEADILEYKIDDPTPLGNPNKPDNTRDYPDRFIHSELYKKFPKINTVLVTHNDAILSFTAANIPLKPLSHAHAFLSAEVPVWDINDASSLISTGSNERHDLLVRSQKVAHHLAAAFRPSTSTGFLTQKLRSALPSQIGGNADDPGEVPAHPVVLMRGAGFVSCANSLEEVVYQGIYTVEAAKALTSTILLRDAYFGETVEGKVDVSGGGMKGKVSESTLTGSVDLKGGNIKAGKVKSEAKDIKYLSSSELEGAALTNVETAMKMWPMWCREMEVTPLYRNEVKREEEEK